MRNKAELINLAKNCAIVFLLISGLFLLYKASFNDQDSFSKGLTDFFGEKQETGTVASSNTDDTALVSGPAYLLVTLKDGSHYAVKYDSESKQKLVAQFLAYLGEALGSARAPEALTEKQWQSALSGTGIFYDYLYPEPLSAIASSLGTEASGEASSKSARRFFLGDGDGKLLLYFISESDGKIYRCNTELTFSSVEPKIADCPVGTAKFAFEYGEEYAKLDPYFIFSHESGALHAVTASNPMLDNFDSASLLGIFGMNSKTASKYPEDDGSTIYVDGEKSLRAESSGRVAFSATGTDGIPLGGTDGVTLIDIVSACSNIVKNSIALTAGDGAVGLSYVSSLTSPSSCTISFSYFVSGIPVTLPESDKAAVFNISDGKIVKAQLYFRGYAISGGTINAIPEKQVSVIAQSHGGEPVLTYEDKGDSLACTWIYN